MNFLSGLNYIIQGGLFIMMDCGKCETLDMYKCCKECDLIMSCPSPCEEIDICGEDLDEE